MKHGPPDLNGGVLLGSGGREYRITLAKQHQDMLKFLAAAANVTEGEMAQRILINGARGSFAQAMAICTQRILQTAHISLVSG